MARSSRTPWPTEPRSVFFDDAASAPTRSKATKDGRVRRIATGVWTADMASPEAEIIEENILAIIARRIGPSVLVDRTAAMAGRINNGVIAIATDSRASDLKLPGVTVRVRPMIRHDSDIPYKDDLHLATPARALVDNLAGPANADRYLTIGELQDWLARKKLDYDDERFNRLREEAHDLAVELDVDVGTQIDGLFAIANQDQGAATPVGEFAAAAATGDLYDERRLNMFSEMRSQLADLDGPRHLYEPGSDGQLPFYEAYFSNYIEGTEFGVEEARRIVDLNEMPADRPEDAHDILNTYYCIIDRVGRASTGTNATALRDMLTERHRTFMAARPTMTPGMFKTKNNYVGSTKFVEHTQVEGTLKRALDHTIEVSAGFARAVYLMVVVAEVHPFLDGNGRAARLMMNAELSAEGLCRIVVPTVCRNEYMSSLRKFTNSGNIDAVVKVLDHCWRWTHSVPWDSRETADGYLATTNATHDSTDAAINQVHLEIF